MTTAVEHDTPATDAAEFLADGETRDGESVVARNRVTRRAAAPRAGVSMVDGLMGEGWLEQAVAQVRESGGRLTGPDSFLSQMVKEVLEAGLDAELTEHLGYAKHEAAGRNSGNSRNGTTPKTVHTEIGPVDLAVPRDRAGTFEPVLLPKNSTRLGGLSDIIISLYASGMTVRDIGAHLQRVYGTELSHDTISTVTDAVLEKGQGLADPPARRGLSDHVRRCIGGEGARRCATVRDGADVRNKAALR